MHSHRIPKTSSNSRRRSSHIRFEELTSRIKRQLGYTPLCRLDRLSYPLSELAVDYFDKNAPFDSLELEFATNLSREGCVHPCTFVMALIYLERLRSMDHEHFTSSTPSELYVTALVLASKFLVDDGLSDFVYNDEWASSAGLDLKRLNQLEVEFLSRIDWNLFAGWDEYDKMLKDIETRIALDRIKSTHAKSFLTFTDLCIILELFSAKNLRGVADIFDSVAKAAVIVCVGYAASLFALFSATIALQGSFSSMLMSTTTTTNVTSDSMASPSTQPLLTTTRSTTRLRDLSNVNSASDQPLDIPLLAADDDQDDADTRHGETACHGFQYSRGMETNGNAVSWSAGPIPLQFSQYDTLLHRCDPARGGSTELDTAMVTRPGSNHGYGNPVSRVSGEPMFSVRGLIWNFWWKHSYKAKQRPADQGKLRPLAATAIDFHSKLKSIALNVDQLSLRGYDDDYFDHQSGDTRMPGNSSSEYVFGGWNLLMTVK